MTRRTTLSAGLGVLALLAGAVLPVTLPTVAAADVPPGVEVTGAACLGTQGVTVVVDFTPAAPLIDIGCAPGTQATALDALTNAGFVTGPGSGPDYYLTTIDGVDATTLTDTYWHYWVSGTDGRADGPVGTEWTGAGQGVGAAQTVRAGSAIALQLQDWNFFPARDASIPLSDLIPSDEPVDPAAYPGAADGDVLAAAGWLGRELAAGDGTLPVGGPTDWGLTVDALLALAAAGVGGDQIEATATALWNSGTTYVGEPEEANAWARVAKTVLALQVAGFDPTVFPAGTGTRNLLLELRTAQNADGQFGSSWNGFGQPLAVLALARTEGGVPAAAVTWTQGQQCTTEGSADDGAYGYSPCSGDVDVTAMIVQALLAAGVPATDPSIADAVAWLTAIQTAAGDGSLPAAWAPIANTNSTGLGGQALLGAGAVEPAAAAAAWIGGLQVSCTTLTANPTTVPADYLGGIAYDPVEWDILVGGEGSDRGQWVRATAQALLGLGLPALGELTAQGAAAALPAAPTCTEPSSSVEPSPAPAPSTSVDSSSPVPPSSSESSSVVAAPTSDTTGTPATSTRPVLSATGVDGNTGPAAALGLLGLLLGAALIVATRTRRTAGRHSN